MTALTIFSRPEKRICVTHDASPLDVFTGALRANGWSVTREEQPTGGPKPTLLEVRRSKQRLGFLVYAWNVSGEGEGRPGDNLRIQTTRQREPFHFRDGYTTIGLGWHSYYGVMGAFDLWAKRFSSHSSSVHIHRGLLEEAATEGWATEVREDVMECAFVPGRVHGYLGWLTRITRPRTIQTRPDTLDVEGDSATVRFEKPTRRFRTRATWFRPGDYAIFVEDDELMDTSVWRVAETVPLPTADATGDDLQEILVTCGRHGRIRDARQLLSKEDHGE